MEDDEVILAGIYGWQILQQGGIVFVGEDIGIICPFGMVCRAGHERDCTIILAIASLVAEPVGLIAGFLGDIDDGGRFEELFVIVLALLGKGALQYGNGLGKAGVSIAIDNEIRIFGAFVEPGRVIIREIRRIGLHVVAGSRFTNDDNDSAWCLLCQRG